MDKQCPLKMSCYFLATYLELRSEIGEIFEFFVKRKLKSLHFS